MDVNALYPVRIHCIVVMNTTAAAAYLQMFNRSAASVTLGTTAPDHVIPVLASGGAVISFGEGWRFPGGGVLNTALSIAGTTTRTGSTGAAIDVFLALNGHQ